jgi:hypothetical protein
LAPVASMVGTTVGASRSSAGQLGFGSSTALKPPPPVVESPGPIETELEVINVGET